MPISPQEQNFNDLNENDLNEVEELVKPMESKFKTNFLTSRKAKEATRENLKYMAYLTNNPIYKTMF